jgi:hypothetical protein
VEQSREKGAGEVQVIACTNKPNWGRTKAPQKWTGCVQHNEWVGEIICEIKDRRGKIVGKGNIRRGVVE